jgi:hypothetical protein
VTSYGGWFVYHKPQDPRFATFRTTCSGLSPSAFPGGFRHWGNFAPVHRRLEVNVNAHFAPMPVAPGYPLTWLDYANID